ncbi:MAG: RHS repeat protein [Acidobacteria bacterium]|nr:RHS repeat protein [Acidobacteriota bacterium]
MIARRSFMAQLLAGTCCATLLSSRSSAFADTVSYTYDALGRVSTVTYSNGASITYAYDAAGNRTALGQTPPNSVQVTLGASPASILAGQSASLSWTSQYATGVSINNGVGPVSPLAGGSVSVSPSATTTYTVTAAGPPLPATAQASVTVYPLPTCTLSASPSTILVGQSTTLTWTSANASSASINNGVGSVTPVVGGSVVVTPSVTTTYTLTVTGALSSQQTAQTAVTVNPNSFNQTIQVTGTGPVNLRSLANAAGYNGTQDANVVFEVGNGVTITGAGGGIAVDTGTWPGSPYTITLSLVVKTGGILRGGGGSGGAGGTPGNGSAGGDAVYCRHPITITIQSGAQVRGGGGGGGGASSVEEGFPEPEYRPGGGGGGGAPNGGGGAGDSGAGIGASGTTSGGGAGGWGINGGVNGGAGGTYGVAGSNGQGWFSPSAPGGTGGAAGYCIRKNGHSVPVTNNGTTSGTIG